MPKVIQPYEHDCDTCKWVGWISIKGQMGNMYVCRKSHSFIEILIRWSDTCDDYSCYSVSLDNESKPYPITVLD